MNGVFFSTTYLTLAWSNTFDPGYLRYAMSWLPYMMTFQSELATMR